MSDYDEDELEGMGLDGAERAEGSGTDRDFYAPDYSRDNWGKRLHTNPYRPKKEHDSHAEQRDEQMWGQTRLITIATAGTGPAAQKVPQMVQATRAARTWSLSFAFELPTAVILPTLPNFTVQVTWIVNFGVGTSFITKYVVQDSVDLVNFAFDPAFPFAVSVPIVSSDLIDQPAKQVLVDAHIRYDRILLAGPANLDVRLTAQAAPVYR
jgi:hypothetical protein